MFGQAFEVKGIGLADTVPEPQFVSLTKNIKSNM